MSHIHMANSTNGAGLVLGQCMQTLSYYLPVLKSCSLALIQPGIRNTSTCLSGWLWSASGPPPAAGGRRQTSGGQWFMLSREPQLNKFHLHMRCQTQCYDDRLVYSSHQLRLIHRMTDIYIFVVNPTGYTAALLNKSMRVEQIISTGCDTSCVMQYLHSIRLPSNNGYP